MHISRRVVLVACATLVSAYSVGVWNTWTAGLATNGWFVALISVPGLLGTLYVAKEAATGVSSPGRAAWSPRDAFSPEPFTINLDSPVGLALGGLAVLATVGVTAGMLFGRTADGWRVDLFLSGIEHPGRFMVLFGVVVLAVASGLFFGAEVEQAAWGLLVGVVCVVVGFAVGIRVLTGSFPEADRIANELSDGGQVVSSGLGSVAAALARDSPPRAEFVDAIPSRHVIGVTMGELLAAPGEWTGTVVTLEGAVGADRTFVRRNRRGESIEAWKLLDSTTNGAELRVLVWRQRGETVPDAGSPCAGLVTITGQIMAVPRTAEEHLVLAAHDWSCATRRPPASDVLNGSGELAVLRRFDRVIDDGPLIAVGMAYRAIPGFDGYIVLRTFTGWRDGTTGSAVFAVPYDGYQATDLCARLVVSAEGVDGCYTTEITFDGDEVIAIR